MLFRIVQPPTEPEYPTYPFQSICIDFFHMSPHNYVALVDRYSNWLSIFQLAKDDSAELIKVLRGYLSIFGVPVTITTDGASVFTSKLMEDFCNRWGIIHRVATAYHPRANKRSEVGVKSAKRLIRGNLTQTGSLDTDKLARALLAHRNTPCPITGLSPAQIVYGRVLRDFLPLQSGKFQPRQEWRQAAKDREAAYAKRHVQKAEQLSRGTKNLPPLKAGDCVSVQNQTGNKPRQWLQTGVVIEAGPFDSYTISIDGSRTITKRNRKYLRKIKPFADHSIPTVSPPPALTAPTKPVQPTTPVALPLPNQPETSQKVQQASSETLDPEDLCHDIPVAQELPPVSDLPEQIPEAARVPPLRLVRQLPEERWMVANPQNYSNLAMLSPSTPITPSAPVQMMIPMMYTNHPSYPMVYNPAQHSNPMMLSKNPMMLSSNPMLLHQLQ